MQAREIPRPVKALLSSAAASLADVSLLIFLSSALHMNVSLSAALAAILGGGVNFILSQRWVFRNSQRDLSRREWANQAALYLVFVVFAGALFSSLLVGFAVSRLLLPVLWAKAFAAAAVFVGWNYPVTSRFVFLSETKGKAKAIAKGRSS